MSAPGREDAVGRVVDAVLDAAPEIRDLQFERRGASIDRENPTGDDVIAADAAADDRLVDRLAGLDGVGAVASEERATVVDAGEGLSVAVDPLDGSSNLAVNAPTGTILGVYDAALPADGRSLVASAIVVYGPVTTAYVAVEGGDVAEYEIPGETAGVGSGEPVVSDPDVTVPAEPTIYGVGGGDDDWPEPVATLVASLREDLKLRYSGAMAADVSQVLTHGGLFAYPQLRSRPSGKLRYQFEVAPVAFLVEQAGGASTDGTGSVLDRPAGELHERAPIYVGSEDVVARVESVLESSELA